MATNIATLESDLVNMGTSLTALGLSKSSSDVITNGLAFASAAEAVTNDLITLANSDKEIALLAKATPLLGIAATLNSLRSDLTDAQEQQTKNNGVVSLRTKLALLSDAAALGSQFTLAGLEATGAAEEAPALAAVFSGATVLAGLGTAISAGMPSEGTADEVVVTASPVTFANGNKGNWEANDDGSVSFVVWNPNQGNTTVSSVTIPESDKVSASGNGFSFQSQGNNVSVDQNGNVTVTTPEGVTLNPKNSFVTILPDSVAGTSADGSSTQALTVSGDGATAAQSTISNNGSGGSYLDTINLAPASSSQYSNPADSLGNLTIASSGSSTTSTASTGQSSFQNSFGPSSLIEDQNGQVQVEQTIASSNSSYTASSGVGAIYNDGANNTINANGIQGLNIFSASDQEFTLNGNAETIDLGFGVNATLNTANSQISTDGDEILNLTGGGGNTVNLGANSPGSDNINGLYETVNVGADVQLNLTGYENTTNAGIGDNIGVAGANQTVFGNAEDNIFITNSDGDAANVFVSGLDSGQTAAGTAAGISLADNSWANVWGSSDNFTLGSGDVLTTEASGSYGLVFNASQSTIFTASNTSFTLNGNQDGLNLGDGDFGTLNTANSGIDTQGSVNLTVTGGGNSFFLAPTDQTADEINGVYESYDLDDDVDARFWGTGNSININNDDTLQLNQGGSYVVDFASGAVNGTSNTSITDDVQATLDGYISGEQADLDGSYSTLTFDGAGAALDVEEGVDNDVANISSGSIVAGAQSAFTIAGSNDQAQLDDDDVSFDGSDEHVDATDSNVQFSDNSSGDTISGSGDTEEGWDGGGGDDGGYGGYGGYGYGGYGFAARKAPTGSSIGSIANYDLTHGNKADALVAETARLQAEAAGAIGATSSALLGAKWNKSTITWTMDVGTGSASPFSGQIGSQYQSAIKQAVATWAHASGLNFDLVSDPADAMLKIGWGTLDTPDTGVLGYTALKASNGQINAGSILLEDPTEDALSTDTSGQLAYSGTGAELEQLALHEIGHALGLADSADPNSIMAPTLTSANETLDAQDLSNIRSLYSSSTTSSGLSSDAILQGINASLLTQSQQLIQAMAGLQSVTGALSSLPLPTVAAQPVLISAGH